MDQLENRLVDVLERVSHQAEPAVARLRNPQTTAHRARGAGRAARSFTVLAAAASVVVVAAAAIGVGVAVSGGDSTGRGTAPATDGPATGGDGTHPLWKLDLPRASSGSFAGLADGDVALPLPRTLDPRISPGVASVPTLVVASGKVRFGESGVSDIWLLAQRPQGTFVLVNRAPDDVDGLHGARVVLVAADGTRRDVAFVSGEQNPQVSPDGETLAVVTKSRIELLDVRTGSVMHSLKGRFTAADWASDDTLVLRGSGEARIWKAPWTGDLVSTGVPFTVSTAVTGGVVTVDDSSGCLSWIDAAGIVTKANCALAWSIDGRTSPDGRYVPLTWKDSAGKTSGGYLDVTSGRLHAWPLPVQGGVWVSATQVLLTEDVEDLAARAACDVVANTCVRVTDEVDSPEWRAADWLGH